MIPVFLQIVNQQLEPAGGVQILDYYLQTEWVGITAAPLPLLWLPEKRRSRYSEFLEPVQHYSRLNPYQPRQRSRSGLYVPSQRHGHIRHDAPVRQFFDDLSFETYFLHPCSPISRGVMESRQRVLPTLSGGRTGRFSQYFPKRHASTPDTP